MKESSVFYKKSEKESHTPVDFCTNFNKVINWRSKPDLKVSDCEEWFNQKIVCMLKKVSLQNSLLMSN